MQQRHYNAGNGMPGRRSLPLSDALRTYRLRCPVILSRGGRGRARCAMAMKLQDEKLFRQHCYVDGEWVDAIGRGTIPVKNPATGETLGTVPKMGAEETRRAIEAADRALAGVARQDREGTRADPAQMVRPDDGEPGRSRDADDRRAGQAAGRGEGRDRLRRLVHRMVRRRRESGSTATRSRRTAPTSASSS